MSATAKFLAGATTFLVGTLIGYCLREVGNRIVVAMLRDTSRWWA